MPQWFSKHSILLLRLSLGIVLLWFGLLKLIDESPVKDLIAQTYYFIPIDKFMLILGIWEVLIGLGLLFKKFLRATFILFWLQMAGTFASLFIYPELFFNGNLFFLTTNGEFVIKNLVLISGGLVIGSHKN